MTQNSDENGSLAYDDFLKKILSDEFSEQGRTKGSRTIEEFLKKILSAKLPDPERENGSRTIDEFLKEIFSAQFPEQKGEKGSKTVEESLRKIFSIASPEPKRENTAILGLDIFEYSQYPDDIMDHVQPVFDLVFDASLKLCQTLERSFFKESEVYFYSCFQHTGDGGLMKFDTPLQALIFNAYFHFCLQLVNQGVLFKNVKNSLLSPSDSHHHHMVVRSVIVKEQCFQYKPVMFKDPAFFGKGFTLCARLLAKDKLDRFLMDDATYKYFFDSFQGFENLPEHDDSTLLECFKKNKNHNSGEPENCNPLISNLLRPDHTSRRFRNNAFASCRVQKLGETFSKKEKLDIYNAEVRLLMNVGDIGRSLRHIYRTTVFNAGENLWCSKGLPEYLNCMIGNLSSHDIIR